MKIHLNMIEDIYQNIYIFREYSFTMNKYFSFLFTGGRFYLLNIIAEDRTFQ